MWDLIFLVFVLFIAVPLALAAWDEYRWLRFRKHEERWHDFIVTSRKGR
jgi:hypothetical protein